MCQWPERSATYESYLQAGSSGSAPDLHGWAAGARGKTSSQGNCLGAVGILPAPWAALRVHWPTFPARMASFWFHMCPERVQERSLASPGHAQVQSGTGRQGVCLDLFGWLRGPKLPNIVKTLKKKRRKTLTKHQKTFKNDTKHIKQSLDPYIKKKR